MSHRSLVVWRSLFICVLVGSAVALAVPFTAPAQAQAGPKTRQSAFADAAKEFGVPESVLLAVAYTQTRWEDHGGAPSTDGGYGPMHLTAVDRALLQGGKGDEIDRRGRPLPSDASLHTLDAAAALLKLSPDVLKRDAAQNIRGGAALLAQYARSITGGTPAAVGDWYGAVVLYSGSAESAVALDFANTVYATIRQGAARTTNDGQQLALPAQAVEPNHATAANVPLRTSVATTATADCPADASCEFIPAAYTLNSADPGDYGNYDLANRPADGLDIRYIVIHDTETGYASTLAIFQNPLSYVSAHYVVRSADGHIGQMVENQNVAWHAGNWYVNMHSIGLEHEGFAIDGATWYSESLYRESARLVRYLAAKYHVPLDRAHIIGHDDIPHPTTGQAGMHWDPGPFWDWGHYMELVGAPLRPDRRAAESDVITINPNFGTNVQTVLNCEGDNSQRTQPTSFVYLYTEPRLDAPLITNPYIGSAPTCANNWGNKAAAGQQFVRVDRQGDWDAIWFGGAKAWFYNPADSPTAVAGRGKLISAKAGSASIPVYGRAYPEDAAYADDSMLQPVTPIDLYTLPAGQQYVAFGPFTSDYYWAKTYSPILAGSDHVVIEGQTEYYQIFFNHRFAFVKAADVDVSVSPNTAIWLPLTANH